MHAAYHLAHGLTRTALLLQRAGPAVFRAGAIDTRISLGHASAFLAVSATELNKAHSAWAGECVRGSIEGKVGSAEGAVFALASLPHGHVRRDVLLFDDPTENLRRAIGRIADQPSGLHAKALLNPFDHRLRRSHLGRSDRRRRYDIQDHGALHIDQIVVRPTEERGPAYGRREPRGRIGERDFLWWIRRTIQRIEIFAHRSAWATTARAIMPIMVVATGHTVLAIGVSADDAGIDSKALATDKAFARSSD